jgi:acetyltransferase-like isoleucine patch superfamily enzyme
MIAAVGRRLAYVKYLWSAGTWRWLLHRMDFLVADHLKPWSELRLPPNCDVHPTVSFRSAANVVLGDRTRIQPDCIVWASPNSTIRIGDNSGIGPQTMIYSSNHRYRPGQPYHDQPWIEKDVTIGRDCWVGGGSVILPGVTIGDGAGDEPVALPSAHVSP